MIVDAGEICEETPDYLPIQDIFFQPSPFVLPGIPMRNFQAFVQFIYKPWVREETHSGLYQYKELLPVLELASRWELSELTNTICNALADCGSQTPLVVKFHAAIRYHNPGLFTDALEIFRAAGDTKEIGLWDIARWIGWRNYGILCHYRDSYHDEPANEILLLIEDSIYASMDTNLWKDDEWDLTEFPIPVDAFQALYDLF